MPVISQVDRSWTRWARILAPVAIALALAGLAAGCGSKNTSATTATSTTTVPKANPEAASTLTTKAVPPPKLSAIPASAAPKAKAYIAAHGADIKKVTALEGGVQVAISEVVNSPLMSPLQDATQKLYIKIGPVRTRLRGPFTHDALGNAEAQVYRQAKAIEDSMHTLLQYTAFPTPATLDEYTTAYQNAILAWNAVVKKIWLAAGVANPPKICTSC